MRDVFEILLKVTLLVGAGLVVTACLRSRAASLRHFILAASLAAAAVVPVAQWVMPPWFPLQALSRPAGQGPVRLASASEDPGSAVARGAAVASSDSASRSDRIPSPPPSWLRAVLWLWAGGSVIAVTPFVIGLVRLRRLERSAQPCGEPAWTTALGDAAGAARLRVLPRLLVARHPTLLATWGVRRARIVLPEGAATWPARRVRVVLAHEIAHIVRRDWLVQGCATVVRAIYFFHPLVWMACRRLRLESERACDDAVLSGGVGAEDYATELVDLARGGQSARASWVPASAMARPSDLEGRVTAMLNADVSRTPLTARTRAVVAAMAMALVASVSGAVMLAQTYSTFSGTTRDEFNTPVSGVTLTLANAGSGQKYEVKSNAFGVFEFVGLPNGDYELQSRLPGFETRTGAVTIAGRNLQRDVDMRIGTLEEIITVRASARDASREVARRPSVGGRVAPPPPAECTASPISGTIKPPTKIADARPVYPAHLLQAAGGGVIVLDALIGTDGMVREAASVDPSANPDLVASAIDAVKLWEFTPTLLNCSPVEAKMKVTVSFGTEP